jgi:hypothetical protein
MTSPPVSPLKLGLVPNNVNLTKEERWGVAQGKLTPLRRTSSVNNLIGLLNHRLVGRGFQCHNPEAGALEHYEVRIGAGGQARTPTARRRSTGSPASNPFPQRSPAIKHINTILQEYRATNKVGISSAVSRRAEYLSLDEKLPNSLRVVLPGLAQHEKLDQQTSKPKLNAFRQTLVDVQLAGRMDRLNYLLQSHTWLVGSKVSCSNLFMHTKKVLPFHFVFDQFMRVRESIHDVLQVLQGQYIVGRIHNLHTLYTHP